MAKKTYLRAKEKYQVVLHVDSLGSDLAAISAIAIGIGLYEGRL